MRPKKRRQSWPLQTKQRRRDDRTGALSQIVHLTLRCMFEPAANFDKQRRLIAYADDPPTRVRCAMTRTAPCFRPPNGTVRPFSRRE